MAVRTVRYGKNDFTISYTLLNRDCGNTILFLHGWGSNKNLMKQSFSKHLDSFRHIYIDLPGFGSSTCNVALQTKDYARIIELFMIHINASKDIVVGHSFGGKVALLLDPKVLVLLSSAGIYIPKSLKVKSKIILFKLLKVFGFAKLRSLFVADDAKSLSEPMYQTFKNVVDEDFSDEFALYNQKALLCWGKDDTATPLSSAKKINTLIKDSMLKVYEGDHYFFMNHAEDISKHIEETFLKTLGS